MSDVIISVENLGKRYILSHQGSGNGGYQRFSERLELWAKSPWRILQQSMESRKGKAIHGKLKGGVGGGGDLGIHGKLDSGVKGAGDMGIHGKLDSGAEGRGGEEEFWALKGVSFEVKRGEVVGIIGRNGAGKSTLLKILSRITEPTEGRVTLRGRVASLLEVGTGFHPELTGRENIFLNGAILGMSKAEIRKKFDEIVAFAEVERFLDTPVKRYSSGMYVRLAFAVAAHLEPEILVVDEVLAVGDAEFQKKCLGKMKDVATQGRTVIFVSHNMTAIKTMCSKSIYLKSGKKVMEGSTNEAIKFYTEKDKFLNYEKIWNEKKPKNGIKLKEVIIENKKGQKVKNLYIENAFNIVIKFSVYDSKQLINLSLVFLSNTDEIVLNSISKARRIGPGNYKAVCEIPKNLLNSEMYKIDLYVVRDFARVMRYEKNILEVELSEKNRCIPWHGKWLGLVRPQLKFNVL